MKKRIQKRTQKRKTLPDERSGPTIKKEFEITINDKRGDHSAYLTVNFYPDGSIGEFFITLDKTGGTVRALLDCWAIGCSCLIQRGGLNDVIDKFEYQRFRPNGFIKDDPDYRSVLSIVDWVAKKLKILRDGIGIDK